MELQHGHTGLQRNYIRLQLAPRDARGPRGEADEGGVAPAHVHGGEHGVRRCGTTLGARYGHGAAGRWLPVADHLGGVDAKGVPHLPHGLRVRAAEARRHTVEHAAPHVARMHHIAHQPEGDPRHLDEPILGWFVIVVAFSEP